MPEKPILIIHPKDKTTEFLDKIKDHLISSFSNQVHHFNIYPNDKSHNDCLERISIHPNKGIIIFLGHGRSDKLFGSKGSLYESKDFVSQEAIHENPDDYYYNDDFINSDNIDVFSSKKVFCLSCNSNNKVAEYAIDKGAFCFLGFGDIPTSKREFEERSKNVSNEIVAKMKTELNYIIKTSLTYSINKNYSFEQLQNIIQFITNQRLSDILINQKLFKERYLFVDYLYYLKKEILIFGNKKLKLLE